MTDLNIPRFGAGLFVLGLVWAVALFILVGSTASLAALFVASIGLLTIALVPDEDDDTGASDA